MEHSSENNARLFSTVLRADWNGLTLQQRQAAPGGKNHPPQPVHTVCLNLEERCALWQQRNGQTRHHIQPYGDAIFMPAGCESRWKWTTPSHALYLLIEPELVRRTAAEVGGAGRELVNSFGASDPRLLHLAFALQAEAEAGGGDSLVTECLSTALAAHLLRQYGSSISSSAPQGRGLSGLEISRITDHVRGNIGTALSLAEIAELVHVSPFHLARLWRRATGKTLHGFVLECRVDAAKHLLHQGDLSVGEVASRAGFAQQSHLAAHFRRVTGSSPAEFRRQARR